MDLPLVTRNIDEFRENWKGNLFWSCAMGYSTGFSLVFLVGSIPHDAIVKLVVAILVGTFASFLWFLLGLSGAEAADEYESRKIKEDNDMARQSEIESAIIEIRDRMREDV